MSVGLAFTKGGSDHHLVGFVDSFCLQIRSSSLISRARNLCAENLHVRHVNGVTSTGLVGEPVRVFEGLELWVTHIDDYW